MGLHFPLELHLTFKLLFFKEFLVGRDIFERWVFGLAQSAICEENTRAIEFIHFFLKKL